MNDSKLLAIDYIYPTYNENGLNVEAFERLISMLENDIKDTEFFMGAWVTALNIPESSRGSHCGTVGCVLGHAAIDPWFVARGWALAENKCEDGFTVIYPVVDAQVSVSIHTFLGINVKQELNIFNNYGYGGENPIRQEVIEKLKTFLKENT